MSSFIEGSTLISAYDVHYQHLDPRKLTFPELVFLDSGGYEARVEHDLSESYGQQYKPEKWVLDMYKEVLRKWRLPRPTVAVSFDRPGRYYPMTRQLKIARELFAQFPQFIPEILVKPEQAKKYIEVEKVLPLVGDLKHFALVGFTERELGPKVIERMEAIARVRRAMDGAGITIPIHIFGSLDSLSTVLYFAAGAEVFDGLTWLRFGYQNGQTIYAQNYCVAQKSGLLQDCSELSTSMWKDNYYYLESLRDQMILLARTGDFSNLADVAEFVRQAESQLQSRLKKEAS